MCLYMMGWRYALEQSCCTENTRGSCSIKTITIAPHPSQVHWLTHTYPIAIGLDGDSHTEVEEKFAAELNDLEQVPRLLPIKRACITCISSLKRQQSGNDEPLLVNTVPVGI